MMPCKGKDVDDLDEYDHDDAERLRPTKHNIIRCLDKYITCFGIKYSLFRAEQGIRFNALKPLNELTPRSPKWATKRGDFRKFSIIFPVLRELDGVVHLCGHRFRLHPSRPSLPRRR
jgi:hypothetical protein